MKRLKILISFIILLNSISLYGFIANKYERQLLERWNIKDQIEYQFKKRSRVYFIINPIWVAKLQQEKIHV